MSIEIILQERSCFHQVVPALKMQCRAWRLFFNLLLLKIMKLVRKIAFKTTKSFAWRAVGWLLSLTNRLEDCLMTSTLSFSRAQRLKLSRHVTIRRFAANPSYAGFRSGRSKLFFSIVFWPSIYITSVDSSRIGRIEIKLRHIVESNHFLFIKRRTRKSWNARV